MRLQNLSTLFVHFLVCGCERTAVVLSRVEISLRNLMVLSLSLFFFGTKRLLNRAKKTLIGDKQPHTYHEAKAE